MWPDVTVRQGVPVPEAGLVKHGELRSQNSHARRVDGSMVVRSTYAPAWAHRFIGTSHATLSGHSLQRKAKARQQLGIKIKALSSA